LEKADRVQNPVSLIFVLLSFRPESYLA